MRQPLVLAERFPRKPHRVELTMKVGPTLYSLWYDETPDMSPEVKQRLLLRKLHEFASQVEDGTAIHTRATSEQPPG